MGGDAVGHLRRCVIIEGGIIGHHTAKQHHIHGRFFFQRFLIGFFVVAASHNQLCQGAGLIVAHKEECIRSFILIDFVQARIFQSIHG